MALSQAQIKGRIKNIAKTNKSDARILMRIYMMERFLERMAKSKYSENFIIKGGILITSLVGVSLRSTMDIDTSIRGFTLSQEEAMRIVKEISEINLEDDVTFRVKSVSGIMDEMDYPGIRFLISHNSWFLIIKREKTMISSRFVSAFSYFVAPQPGHV